MCASVAIRLLSLHGPPQLCLKHIHPRNRAKEYRNRNRNSRDPPTSKKQKSEWGYVCIHVWSSIVGPGDRSGPSETIVAKLPLNPTMDRDSSSTTRALNTQTQPPTRQMAHSRQSWQQQKDDQPTGTSISGTGTFGLLHAMQHGRAYPCVASHAEGRMHCHCRKPKQQTTECQLRLCWWQCGILALAMAIKKNNRTSHRTTLHAPCIYTYVYCQYHHQNTPRPRPMANRRGCSCSCSWRVWVGCSSWGEGRDARVCACGRRGGADDPRTLCNRPHAPCCC